MQLFFQIGGGPCFIVSVGGCGDPIGRAALIEGIATLTQEREPTLVVIPDAVSLTFGACIEVQPLLGLGCLAFPAEGHAAC